MANLGKEYNLIFNLSAVMQNGFSSIFSQTQSSLNAVSEAATTLNQKISAMQGFRAADEELTRLVADSISLETAFQDVVGELAQTEAAYRSLTAEEEQQKAVIEQLENERKVYQQGLSEERQRVIALCDSSEALFNDMERQLQEVQKLEAQQEKEKAALEKTREALNNLDETTKNYEKRFATLVEREQQQENQLAKTTAALDKARTEYNQSLQQILKLEQEIEKATASQRDWAAAAQLLDEELEKEKAKLGEDSNAVAANRERVQQLLDKKAELENRIHSNNQALETTKNTLQRYREQLEKAGVNLSLIEQELEKANAELAEEEARLKAAAEEQEKIDQYVEYWSSLASAMSGVNTVLNAISSASGTVTSAFASCISAAAELEYQMSAVQAVSGATDEELEGLTEMVEQLGLTTIYTASEVASAAQVAALAGWTYEEMLSGIPAVTKLAAASGEELADVTSTVSDAMNAFGLSGSDAVTMFSDTLVKAATSANTTVAQLSAALSYVESTAANLGYSIQDVTVVLDVLANSSLKADVAGSALNTMLTRMSGANSNATAQMEALGLSMYDAEGNSKDLLTFMEELRESFAEFGDDAQAAQIAAYKLAGQRGMRALLSIVNTSDEAWEELVDAIYDYEGATETISDIRLDNYTGQLQLLEDAWEQLKVTVGNNFLPVATDALEWATDMLTTLQPLAESTGDLQTGIAAGALTLQGITSAGSAATSVIQQYGMALLVLEKSTALKTLTENSRVLSGIMGTFKSSNNPLLTLTGTLLGVGVAVAAVVTIASAMAGTWSDATEEAKALQESLEELESTAEGTAEELRELLGSNLYSSDDISDAIGDMESQLAEYQALLEEAEAAREAYYQENSTALTSADAGWYALAARSAMNQYSETITEVTEKIEEQEAAIKEAKKAYVAALAEEAGYLEEVNGLTDDQSDLLDTLAEQAEGLGEAWDNAYTSIYTTLTGQYGLLDAVTNEVQENLLSTYSLLDAVEVEYDSSVSTMITNLQSQVKAYTKYSEGLDAILSSGVDVSGIWDQLSDGSEDAMVMVQAIYSAIQDGDYSKLESLVEEYEKLYEITETVAEQTGTSASEIKANLESQLEAAIEYRDNLETILNSGVDVSNLWDSISDGSEEAQETAKTLADAIRQDNAQLVEDINSTQGEINTAYSDIATTVAEQDEAVQESIASIIDTLQQLGEGGEELYELAASVTQGAIQGYIDGLEDEDTRNALTLAIDSIMGILDGEYQGIDWGDTGAEQASDYVTGFSLGINGDARTQLAADMMGLGEDYVVNPFAEAIGVHSPSTVAEEQAQFYVEGFVLGIDGAAAQAVAAMEAMAESLKSAFGEAMSYSTFYQYGKWSIEGAINGATSKRSALIATYKALAVAASEAFANAIEIGSPSRLFRQYGVWSIEGAELGAESERDKLEGVYASLGSTSYESYTEGAESVAPSAMYDTTSSTEGDVVIQLNYAPVITVSGNASGESVKEQLDGHDDALLAKVEALFDELYEGRIKSEKRKVR